MTFAHGSDVLIWLRFQTCVLNNANVWCTITNEGPLPQNLDPSQLETNGSFLSARLALCVKDNGQRAVSTSKRAPQKFKVRYTVKEMDHTTPSTFTVVLERPGPEDVESLLRIRDMWDRNCEMLRDKLDLAERHRQDVNLMIELARGTSVVESAARQVSSTETSEQTTTALPHVANPSRDAEPVSGAAVAKDISHCRTQREASYVIAEINSGDIDLKSAARVIKAAGLSDGMLNTIVSSLHHFMSHSDDWNYTGPSQFELLACREDTPESGLAADSGAKDSSAAGVSEVGPTTLRAHKETAA